MRLHRQPLAWNKHLTCPEAQPRLGLFPCTRRPGVTQPKIRTWFHPRPAPSESYAAPSPVSAPHPRCQCPPATASGALPLSKLGS